MTSERVNILLVDDTPANLIALEAALACPDYNIVALGSGKQALDYLANHECAVILLDVQMPIMNGFDVAQALRKKESLEQRTPIVFVTANQTDEEFVQTGYSAGAVDYLLKPLNINFVRYKVSVFADLYRAKREIARQARQERSQVLEHALDALIGVDQDDRILDWNPQAEATFGWKKEEVLGKVMRELLIPERFREAHRHGMARFLSTGSGPILNSRIEVQALRKNGKEFPAELTVTALKTLEGYKFYSFLRDITDRKKHEDALSTSEKRFRTHYEQAPFSIQLLSPDGRTRAVNQAWRNLFNLPEEFIQNYVLKEYNMLADAQLEAKGVLPFIKKGFAGEASEIPAILYDPRELGVAATPRWLRAFIYPVKDAQGKITEVVLTHTDVTGQMTAEEDLRRSRDELKIIFDNVADGIIVQDSHYKCVYANEVGAKLCGYSSADELANSSINDTLKCFEIRDEHGNPFPLEKLPARLVFAGIKDVPETVMRVEDLRTGAEMWSVTTARPILNHEGQPHLAVSIFRDISNQRQYEQELKRSEEQLKLITDALPVFVSYLDWRHHFTFINETYERWFSLPRATVLGRHMREIIGERAYQERRPYIERALNGESTRLETRFSFPNREERDLVFDFIPDKGNSGVISGVVVLASDVTEQKRSEDAKNLLAEASTALASSLDYNEILQAVANLSVPRLADWCAIDVVESTGPRSVALAHPDTKMLKLAEELRLKYPPDWNAPTGAPCVIRTGKAELYSDISDELLVRVAKSEEHLKLIRELGLRSAIVVPISARGKTLGALTLVSTHQTRRYGDADLSFAEELGRRAGIAVDNALLYREAQSAIRARDEFLSIASHELRTPLTSLKLQAQSSKRSIEKGDPNVFSREKITKLVDGLDRQTDRLTRLVEDMLDISRMNTGKLRIDFESVDMSTLLKEVLERFEKQLSNADCKVALNVQDSVLGLWDRGRIDQVISNLLTNALKYGAGRPISITLSTDRENAVLRMKDQGIGIAEKDQIRIFERFERAISANEVSGLGLGLYIVRQILELHGGSIFVQSRLGEGSEFTVTLPLQSQIV